MPARKKINKSKPEVPDVILNKPGAANLLETTHGKITYLVRTHQIPFFRLGRRDVRFNRNRLLEWAKSKEE